MSSKEPKESPSLTSAAPAASSSSSSASSSTPADTSVSISSDGLDVIPEPVVNPHITFRNWLIATAVIACFILLLLVANASESVPEATVWLILFASVWAVITLCCGMFKTAERCATYVREQELNGGYLGTSGQVETTGAPAAAGSATDSGAGDAKYQKL